MRAVATALPSEVRWAPFSFGKVKLAMVDSLLTAVIEVGRDHPAVAAWMLDQWERLDDLERQWQRSYFRLRGSSALATRRGEYLAAMAVVFSAWAAYRIDDDWFEDHAGTMTDEDLVALQSRPD